MALTLYWGSGSPFSWRVLLALEHKGLPYESQLLHFDKQEHQSPQMLKMNPRGRVPVLKDGDYVVFESVAVLYYLDVKYPQPPIFGADARRGRRHHARHLRIPGLRGAVAAEDRRCRSSPTRWPKISTNSPMPCTWSAREARTIEGRLSKEEWIVGANYSATDMVIFPVDPGAAAGAGQSGAAAELGARFLPMERNYPALARWIHRIESLPGLRTYLSAALARP